MSGTPPPPVRIIDGKKTFIPLENNPDSLARLAHLLGITSISFHDIYSLDPIIQEIPRPVHALIFIAPAPVYHVLWGKEAAFRTPKTLVSSDEQAGVACGFALAGPDAPVMWFKQTIGHACGLMSLVHAVANGKAADHVQGAGLRKILLDAVPLGVEARAKLLYDSAELESAHMLVAAAGETRAPDPCEPNGMHFITFVKTLDGVLWELEGGNSLGPVELGRLREDQDVLCQDAVCMGPGRYIDVGAKMGIAEFSCVALVLE